jgi:hypothetical protein
METFNKKENQRGHRTLVIVLMVFGMIWHIIQQFNEGPPVTVPSSLLLFRALITQKPKKQGVVLRIF